MDVTSTRAVKVGASGRGVVAHVGLHALGAFADRLHLSHLLSATIPQRPLLVHDRGKVLVQTALMLAGGGESCADIEHLRAQESLFGLVPSDSTTYRTFFEISPETRREIGGAVAEVREQVWARSAATKSGPVVLDIDASLVPIHSENKECAAPNFKGGYGFHLMFCFADATGEALSGLLRPGSDGSNTAADHITVLDEAIAQLPKEVRAGHSAGDDASLVRRQVICRTDSAGTTAAFLSALRARNVGFFTSAITNTQIQAAILDAIGIEGAFVPAVTQDGEERPRTAVCELTSLVELSSFPSGTRLIVRREPLHPGAQRSLFPSLEHRYWGFYTDQEGDPVSLDVTMRAHAHVENHICRLKDSGLLAFPFTSFEANKNWMAVVMLAADLVRWFQLLCLDGYFASARPKALRWAILHAPGRIVRSGRQVIVRLLANWPDAGAILRAYRHIEALT
ncbi:MAG: IS1380 family transposase [Acidimicrobiales bacterium]